jgi:hypothetical protein
VTTAPPASARRRWSSRLRLLAGVAVSLVFLYYVFQGLRFDEFVRDLEDAQYIWIVPGVFVYFLGVVARTWRWQFMLRPFARIPIRPLFRIVCIGYFGNNVFPARAGEVLRSYELRYQYRVSMTSSLTTVLIERTFDGLVMLLFVAVALPFVTFESVLADYQQLIVAFTAIFVGALLVFLALAAKPAAARAIYAPVVRKVVPSRFAERALAAGDRVLIGFESLSRGRDVFMIFGTSVLVWLFETGKYWFVMHAFPFDVSFVTLMLMNGVVNLATTLPAAPAYLGTFDLPGIRILMAAGVAQATATAYTLVLHVALWLPITALGAYYLWQSHMGWRPRDMAAGRWPEAAEAGEVADGAPPPEQAVSS